jgi:hypothetical protein
MNKDSVNATTKSPLRGFRELRQLKVSIVQTKSFKIYMLLLLGEHHELVPQRSLFVES